MHAKGMHACAHAHAHAHAHMGITRTRTRTNFQAHALSHAHAHAHAHTPVAFYLFSSSVYTYLTAALTHNAKQLEAHCITWLCTNFDVICNTKVRHPLTE